MKKVLLTLLILSLIFTPIMAYGFGQGGEWNAVGNYLMRCLVSIVPSKTNTFNLGSSSLYWANGYITNIALGTSITMADGSWIGLGAAKGRLVFNDETTDTLDFLTALIKIGTGSPGVATAAGELYVEGDIETDANLDVAGTGTITTFVTPYTDVYTLAQAGGDYTDMLTAIAAMTDGDTLLVYPGTYTDTGIFGASNIAVVGIGKAAQIIFTQVTANVLDFNSRSGIRVENIKLLVSGATSAVATVTGSTGAATFKSCHIQSVNASVTTTVQPSCITLTGDCEIKTVFGTIDYDNGVDDTTGSTALKAAVLLGTSAEIECKRTIIDIDGGALATDTSSITSAFYAVGSGLAEVYQCVIEVTDIGATLAGGYYLIGSGASEAMGNDIHVTVGAGTAYAIYMAGTTTLRSMFNHLHAVDTGGASYGIVEAGTGSVVSQFDDIVADNASTGSITYVHSASDGALSLSGDATVGDLLSYDESDWTGGNVIHVPLAGSIETYHDAATAGDTLVLASGTYTITDDIDITKAINIVGQGIGKTTVTCATANKNIFDIAVSNVRIDNMTLTSTATGNRIINTVTDLTGLVFENLATTHSTSGNVYSIRIYGSSADIRNVVASTTSSDDKAYVFYFENDSSTGIDMTVNCYNVHGTGDGTGDNSIGYYSYNNDDANTITVNLYDCTGIALDGGGADNAVWGVSTTTETVTVNVYGGTYDGADYDAGQNNANVINLYDTTLVNGTTSGTITYGGTNVTDDLYLQSINGNTLFVGPNMAYSTITLALAAVVDGDTILVSEGTYTETITFADDNVTLKALGSKENTTITQAAADAILFGASSGCVLEGFTISITAADAAGDIVIEGSNDDASDYNIIKDCDLIWASTVVLDDSYLVYLTDGNWKFENCSFTSTNTYAGASDSTSFALRSASNAGVKEFVNCKVTVTNAGTGTGTAVNGFLLAAGDTATIRNCEFDIDGACASTAWISALSSGGSSAVWNVYDSTFVVDGSGTAECRGIRAGRTGDVLNSRGNTYDITSVGGTEYWGATVSGAILNSYHDAVIDGGTDATGTVNTYVQVYEGATIPSSEVLTATNGGVAASLLTDTTVIITDAGGADANNVSLADGVLGQTKIFTFKTETTGGDTVIITPNTPVGFATVTFDAIGDTVTMMFDGTSWTIIGEHASTIA